MSEPYISDYGYHDTEPTWANAYLWPRLQAELAQLRSGTNKKVLDLGCGNGATVNMLAALGWEAVGIDPSKSGIEAARAAFPNCRFEVASTDMDLAALYGQFPVVVSLEVVEHVYSPNRFAQRLYELVEPGGAAIVSTPYHGYLKNLALAVAGKWESHLGPLWEGGHIKFFSIATLRQLLERAGFRDIRFQRVGRLPPLAKSMMAVATRPVGQTTRHDHPRP